MSVPQEDILIYRTLNVTVGNKISEFHYIPDMVKVVIKMQMSNN